MRHTVISFLFTNTEINTEIDTEIDTEIGTEIGWILLYAAPLGLGERTSTWWCDDETGVCYMRKGDALGLWNDAEGCYMGANMANFIRWIIRPY